MKSRKNGLLADPQIRNHADRAWVHISTLAILTRHSTPALHFIPNTAENRPVQNGARANSSETYHGPEAFFPMRRKALGSIPGAGFGKVCNFRSSHAPMTRVPSFALP